MPTTVTDVYRYVKNLWHALEIRVNMSREVLGYKYKLYEKTEEYKVSTAISDIPI